MSTFDLSLFEAPLAMPELEAGPVVLRPFSLADLPLVRQAAADPYIPTITSVPATYSDDEGRAFIARQHERAEGGHGFPFVIAQASEPDHGVGSLGLWLREIESGRATIGYWLLPAARGHGLAQRALMAVVRFAFEELAIPRLQLFVEPWNTASRRTAEAAGFSEEALLRGWERIGNEQHDAYAYALRRDEWAAPASRRGRRMSPVESRPDPDPDRWADPAATYDTLASRYAERFVHELDHKPFDRDLLTRFAAAVGPGSTAAAPVCDLGCGPGQVAGYLAHHGVRVIGIDLSAGMVEEARRRFPDLTFAPGDMTALDRPDESLSGIACFYALIHLPRSRVPVALGEMRRVLTVGGGLLLAVHGGSGSLHATEMAGRPADLDATLFALPELTGLVDAAGFDVVEAHERAPYEEEGQTRRLYVWARRAE